MRLADAQRIHISVLPAANDVRIELLTVIHCELAFFFSVLASVYCVHHLRNQ